MNRVAGGHGNSQVAVGSVAARRPFSGCADLPSVRPMTGARSGSLVARIAPPGSWSASGAMLRSSEHELLSCKGERAVCFG
ncbi:MAG: hypothetical protein OXG81_04985 [Acidobacteria bacterium]|nr:hypothetical protein [Acidobacteriota bacterium]